MWLFAASLGFLVHSATAITNLKATGPPVDVWAAVDRFKHCGDHLIDTPDIPPRAFRDTSGITHMIAGSTAYYRMSGPSVLNQTRACNMTLNKTADPDPRHFAGDEYMDSPIGFGNGTVVALVHTEYPGNRYNSTGPNAPMCPGVDGAYPKCWTVTVGLFVSDDWGATFRHARPPPEHLVAAVPYGYNASQLAYGWGDPSNIVKNPKDGYYYAALWNRNQVGLQAPGICVMRTKNLLDPRSWRAWDGNAFTKTFVSPYTMAPGTEADHVCTVTNLPLGCAPAGLAWSTYLEKFVVTMGCDRTISLATSDDLINWSDSQEVDVLSSMTASQREMVRSLNYPTFMDPKAPDELDDPNYGTLSQTPYLFWVSFGDNPYHYGRRVWATPFKFEKN